MKLAHRRQFLHLAAGASALVALLAFPEHRAWPQGARTIKLVVPFPPGGGIDSLARIMAEEVGRTQGVVVVVENRPGAGTVIATEAVMRAKPDGNTLLVTLNSPPRSNARSRMPSKPIPGSISPTPPRPLSVTIIRASSPSTRKLT